MYTYASCNVLIVVGTVENLFSNFKNRYVEIKFIFPFFARIVYDIVVGKVTHLVPINKHTLFVRSVDCNIIIPIFVDIPFLVYSVLQGKVIH